MWSTRALHFGPSHSHGMALIRRFPHGRLSSSEVRLSGLDDTEQVTGRKVVVGLWVCGTVLGLTACGSPGSLPATPSRSACTLLPRDEAAAAFGAPVLSPQANNSNPGNQSFCSYYPTVGSKPGILIVDVSWNKRAVHTFTVLHSGHAVFVPGTTPNGETIQPPRYAKVTVAGIPSYWRTNPSAPSGVPVGGVVNNLSAMKHLYVVDLSSQSLSEAQDEEALAVILNRL